MPEFFNEIEDPKAPFYIHHMHLAPIESELHFHSKDQLLYAQGGIVHVFVNQKHWYLPAKCFMWIPAGTPHSVLSHSKYGDLYNLYFEKEESEVDFYGVTDIYHAGDLLIEMILYTKEWKGKIKASTPQKYYFLKALKAILPDFKPNKLPSSIQHPYPKDESLLAIAQFLNKNLEYDYTLEQVAKKFGYSSRTLSRKFKDNLGMSYVRFLRSLRITKAFELIAENRYNMYEVATLVGYSSLAAFSNIFYKITGIRPTEYAKLTSKK